MIAFAQFDRKRVRKLAVVLAILLVATFALTEAVHTHADHRLSDSSHCSLCATAHAAPVVVAPPVLAPVLYEHALLVATEPTLQDSVALFSLYSRPPPLTA